MKLGFQISIVSVILDFRTPESRISDFASKYFLACSMFSDSMDVAKILEPGFLASGIRITFHGVTSTSGLKLVARP